MRRSIHVLLLGLFVAGCSSHAPQEVVRPDYTYALVVDGKVAKTIEASANADEISAVVQPRSGESPIWQNHGATYAHIVLEPSVQEVTPEGGAVVRIDGEVEYYRDLKYRTINGYDEVVRGRPIAIEDVERQTVTVAPGAPGSATVAEGIAVVITALPKSAPAPQP